EQPGAEEGVAEKEPGVGPAACAFDQGGEPGEDGLVVFAVLKRVEQPRRGVGDEIEQRRAEQAAAEQAGEGGRRFEPASEQDDRKPGDVINELVSQDGEAPDV